MRVINQGSWPRRKHFNIFRGLEYPHNSVSVQVDITALWERRDRLGTSPTIGLVYVLARAANRVPELRQRIRGEQVIEHDVIHPVIPVLGADDLFSMCQLSYDACFRSFAADAEERIEKAKEHVAMDGWPYDENGSLKRDDQLFITVFPWFSLTAFSLTRPSEDSFPLLAYGKVLIDGDRSRLPVSVSFHHGLVDGLHVARFIGFVEEEATRLEQSLA